jgi:hypothetical protein
MLLPGFQPLRSLVGLIMSLMSEVFIWVTLIVRPRTTLAAETLLLRKQLAFYQEHQVPPKRR